MGVEYAAVLTGNFICSLGVLIISHILTFHAFVGLMLSPGGIFPHVQNRELGRAGCPLL